MKTTLAQRLELYRLLYEEMARSTPVDLAEWQEICTDTQNRIRAELGSLKGSWARFAELMQLANGFARLGLHARAAARRAAA